MICLTEIFDNLYVKYYNRNNCSKHSLFIAFTIVMTERDRIVVTVGTEKYSSEYSIDEWIDEADKKLYYGKNNGKNQVVY